MNQIMLLKGALVFLLMQILQYLLQSIQIIAYYCKCGELCVHVGKTQYTRNHWQHIKSSKEIVGHKIY